MWYEILNTCLIDPYSICHNTLYAEGNRHFLEFTLPDLPRDVPPETRNSLKYYQRHRAPAHNARAITRYLISIYGEKWFDIRQPCHHVHVHVTKILFTACGIFFINSRLYTESFISIGDMKKTNKKGLFNCECWIYVRKRVRKYLKYNGGSICSRCSKINYIFWKVLDFWFWWFYRNTFEFWMARGIN